VIETGLSSVGRSGETGSCMSQAMPPVWKMAQTSIVGSLGRASHGLGRTS
jgi:hypothetical protein